LRKTLKVDLHTHCGEATRAVMPSESLVARIIETARAKGLDGMAITEHWSATFAKAFDSIMRENFTNEDFLFIPGREIQESYDTHIVELFLPDGTTFAFLAHPRRLKLVEGIRGVELENNMNGVPAKEAVSDFARANNLAILRNSDAHSLDDIGTFYNDLLVDTATGEWFLEGVDGTPIRIL